jgi:hypothetical protein
MKLDFGCGHEPRVGFEGVDIQPWGQAWTVDLRGPWPWADASVDEAHTSHFIEHLTMDERCHFFRELHRVLKPGAECQVIAPHWSSSRAYGDPTHIMPPISEWFFYYLNKKWRAENAPHTEHLLPGVDFDIHCGFGLHPTITGQTPNTQKIAIEFMKEAVQDVIMRLVKF